MLISMTGFGKAISKTTENKKYIEIKTLNSKHLDINIKIPIAYKEKEIELRTIIAKKLIRGKIELNVYDELDGNEQDLPINTNMVKTYFKQFKKIADELNINADKELLPIIMKMPDILTNKSLQIDENEWVNFLKYLDEAINEVINFRKQEGEELEKDITKRIANILELLKQVEPFEKQRVDNISQRIKNNLSNFLDNDNVDENRFEQEMIYYLEKLDITEEKVRLKTHCNYFLQTIKTDEPVGKKIGFITQEMGREINTLGSKANNSDIQRIVILMKDELEKIKEQMLNIL